MHRLKTEWYHSWVEPPFRLDRVPSLSITVVGRHCNPYAVCVASRWAPRTAVSLPAGLRTRHEGQDHQVLRGGDHALVARRMRISSAEAHRSVCKPSAAKTPAADPCAQRTSCSRLHLPESSAGSHVASCSGSTARKCVYRCSRTGPCQAMIAAAPPSFVGKLGRQRTAACSARGWLGNAVLSSKVSQSLALSDWMRRIASIPVGRGKPRLRALHPGMRQDSSASLNSREDITRTRPVSTRCSSLQHRAQRAWPAIRHGDPAHAII